MPPKNKKKEPDNETLTRIAIVSSDRCVSEHDNSGLLYLY